jgi:hypothetical protein
MLDGMPLRSRRCMKQVQRVRRSRIDYNIVAADQRAELGGVRNIGDRIVGIDADEVERPGRASAGSRHTVSPGDEAADDGVADESRPAEY